MENQKDVTILKRITRAKQFKVFLVFIILYVVLSILAPDTFFTIDNIVNIFRQTSAELILAIGMTFVIIVGGIDLSVGGIANLCGTFLAGLMVLSGLSVPVAVLSALILGIVIGVISGLNHRTSKNSPVYNDACNA